MNNLGVYQDYMASYTFRELPLNLGKYSLVLGSRRGFFKTDKSRDFKVILKVNQIREQNNCDK